MWTKMQCKAEARSEMLRPPSLQRGCAAAIACMASFGLGVQFYFNIQDALIGKLPMVGHLIQFFSYVTIETNLLIALVLTSSWAWPQAKQYLTKSSVTSALVVYIVVVGGVYEVLLRHLWHPQGLRLLADVVLHDAVPFLYPIYWLVFLPKGTLRWANPAWWLVYPVIYFFYSMVRGATLGAYPYPFIDAAHLGLSRVSMNATIFFAVIFTLGLIVTAIDHALNLDNRDPSGLGTAAEL